MMSVDVYFPEKGYGFGSHSDQEGNRTKFFFHISDVVQGSPLPGAEITCVLIRNAKGLVAKNIKVLPPQTGGAQ